MIKNNTYPELIKWVPQYLFKQGKDKFVALHDMSPMMWHVGATQDNIGWKYFTEGKITRPLRNLQELWLLSKPTCLTIDAWARGLIKKLLALTHSQWIFRNIIEYHHTNGTIKLEAKQDDMKEIKRQLNLGLCNIPPGNRFLPKIDTSEPMTNDIENQQYWLFAINDTRAAGK